MSDLYCPRRNIIVCNTFFLGNEDDPFGVLILVALRPFGILWRFSKNYSELSEGLRDFLQITLRFLHLSSLFWFRRELDPISRCSNLNYLKPFRPNFNIGNGVRGVSRCDISSDHFCLIIQSGFNKFESRRIIVVVDLKMAYGLFSIALKVIRRIFSRPETDWLLSMTLEKMFMKDFHSLTSWMNFGTLMGWSFGRFIIAVCSALSGFKWWYLLCASQAWIYCDCKLLC